MRQTFSSLLCITFLLTGCLSFDKRETVKGLPENQNPAAQAPILPGVQPSDLGRVLKRKVAIARFTNETKYGSGLFTDVNYDRIGKQASDMLASDLTKSGKFIVLEREDLNKLKAESELMGMSAEEFKKNLVGVDA